MKKKKATQFLPPPFKAIFLNCTVTLRCFLEKCFNSYLKKNSEYLPNKTSGVLVLKGIRETVKKRKGKNNNNNEKNSLIQGDNLCQLV